MEDCEKLLREIKAKLDTRLEQLDEKENYLLLHINKILNGYYIISSP